MRSYLIPALLLSSAMLTACATYRDDLNRAERHFQANEYEKSLALFRALEPDMNSLSYEDRARYAYLRGMNDYRLGKPYRTDARHWLAIAQAMEEERPGVLLDDWKSQLQQALDDLNQDVYGTGVTGTPSKQSSDETDKNESDTTSPESDSPTDASAAGDDTAQSQ